LWKGACISTEGTGCAKKDTELYCFKKTCFSCCGGSQSLFVVVLLLLIAEAWCHLPFSRVSKEVREEVCCLLDRLF